MSKLILAPSFRLLSGRLLTELRSRTDSEVFAPRWVVTPSSALAGQLRLKLARESESGVLPAIRVSPLLAFIDRFSELTGGGAGARWSPLLDIRLYELVHHARLRRRLTGLRAIRGGHQLLRSTFLDLVDAGFGLDHLELLQELAAEPDVDEMGSEVLELYCEWLARLHQCRILWAPLLQQALPEAISGATDRELERLLGGFDLGKTRIYIHGFYDFTDVSAGILTALARRVSTTFFLPFEKSAQNRQEAHPAFAFLDPVLDDLRVRLGTSLSTVETLEPGPADPVRFFLSTFPEGPVEAQPPFLSFQHASGLRAEVVSAALRVRRWLDDPVDPLAPEDIMVVPPTAEGYADLVREVFAAFAIPLRLVDVPDLLPASDRILRAVAKLWEEQAPSEWLLGYCREYPSLPCLKKLDLDAFETKLRSIAFDGSRWPALLEIGDQFVLREAEKEFIREVAAVWTRPVEDPQQPVSAAEVAERLDGIADRWIPDPAPLAPLQALFRTLPPDFQVPLGLVFDLLLSETGQQTVNQPREQAGVLFAPLMRARGLTARAIVLLGLASGRLPFQIEEDPLLADGVRRRLSYRLNELGHRLAPKSAISEEMALLFMLLNGSAEVVHWIIPQTDENGRTVAATPWVQRYLQHWAPAADQFHPIPRGPAEQARFLLELDPDRGRFLPPALGAYLDPEIGSADEGIPYSFLLGRLNLKPGEKDWNGVIPAAALPRPGVLTTVRVTELERLSKCPFQFYSRVIARWEPLSPLEFSQDLKSTDWGSLLHRLFDLTLRSYQGSGVRTSEIAKQLLQDDAALLIKQINEMGTSVTVPFHLLPPLFQRAARTKLIESARLYWQAVQDGSIADGLSLCTEKRCTASYPNVPGIVLSGQIDRLDDRGPELVIIDYKSGREPENLAQEIRFGFKLQPSLYAWLEKSNSPEDQRPRRFCYVFFTRVPLQEKAIPDGPVDLADWLKLFAGVLAGGTYITTSNEALELLGFEKANPCQFCEFPSLCRRFERQAPERSARFMQQLLPKRLEAMERE